jgi:hypothetical protein
VSNWLVADESSAVLDGLELVVVARLGLRTGDVVAVVAGLVGVELNGGADLDVGNVTDLDLGVDGGKGGLGLAERQAVVDIGGVASVSGIAVLLLETLAADGLVVGDVVVTLLETLGGAGLAGLLDGRADGRDGRDTGAGLGTLALVAAEEVGEEIDVNESVVVLGITESVNIEQRTVTTRAGARGRSAGAARGRARAGASLVTAEEGGKEINIDQSVVVLGLTQSIEVEKRTVSALLVGEGLDVNDGGLATLVLATNLEVEELVGVAATVVVEKVDVNESGLALVGLTESINVDELVNAATVAVAAILVVLIVTVVVVRARVGTVAGAVVALLEVVEEVEVQETILAEELKVEDVAVVAELDGQERVDSDLIILDVDLVTLANLASGLHVLLELLLSEEAEKDKELKVEDDGGLLADGLGDFVAATGLLAALGVVAVVDRLGRLRLGLGASGSDADVVILLLNLVRAIGLDVDLLADTEVDDSREIEQAARVAGEDLQLSDDISHCRSWFAYAGGSELLGSCCKLCRKMSVTREKWSVCNE